MGEDLFKDYRAQGPVVRSQVPLRPGPVAQTKIVCSDCLHVYAPGEVHVCKAQYEKLHDDIDRDELVEQLAAKALKVVAYFSPAVPESSPAGEMLVALKDAAEAVNGRV